MSFHQPSMMCGITRLPVSIIRWMASVISSSPRALGSMASIASKISEEKRYTPDQRQVGSGHRRLLHERDHPSVLELGHPEPLRLGNPGQQDHGVGRGALEFVDQRADSLGDQVVAEIHDEAVPGEEVAGDARPRARARVAPPGG